MSDQIRLEIVQFTRQYHNTRRAMPSNANASARVLHHQVDGSTLAQFYRSATKHLSRDQLVKGLLVIKAVLDQSLVNIFAWEPNLGKLRE